MTCRNCKYEWCRICLQEYLPGHYDSRGKCKGLQYSNCPCLSNQFCLFFCRILFHILECLKLLGIFPIVFYIFTNVKIRQIYWDLNILTFFISFYICLCFLVYATSIMFIIFIIMIFCCPFKRIISRKFDEIF